VTTFGKLQNALLFKYLEWVIQIDIWTYILMSIIIISPVSPGCTCWLVPAVKAPISIRSRLVETLEFDPTPPMHHPSDESNKHDNGPDFFAKQLHLVLVALNPSQCH
jgi:hypothetical protein